MITAKSTKSVPAHITPFLEYCAVEKGLSTSTQRNYTHFLRVFTRWLEQIDRAACLPHRLTEDDIWNYRLYLAEKHLTPVGKNLSKRTQRHYLVALRALLGYFHHRSIETLSPALVTLPKQSDRQGVAFLPFPEIQKLLDIPDVRTTSGLRNRAIMELLFSTGLRVSELVALDTETVAIVLKKSKKSSCEITVTGKGGVTRPAYISTRAADWLRTYLATRADDHQPLFINYAVRQQEDRRLTPRAIQMMIRQASAIAGISKKITPHILRHSYATDLLSHGADLRAIQELMGHKHISATQIYTHLTNMQLRNVHESFHTRPDADQPNS